MTNVPKPQYRWFWWIVLFSSVFIDRQVTTIMPRIPCLRPSIWSVTYCAREAAGLCCAVMLAAESSHNTACTSTLPAAMVAPLANVSELREDPPRRVEHGDVHKLLEMVRRVQGCEHRVHVIYDRTLPWRMSTGLINPSTCPNSRTNRSASPNGQGA